MSLADGMAALNLEMPDRVPRTEYSIETNYELLSAVTGIEVKVGDDFEKINKALFDFKKIWNYDFIWNITFGGEIFGDKKTKMGHASYSSQGADYDNQTSEFYDDPEETLKFDPWELYGNPDESALLKRFNEHYHNAVNTFPDAVNMPGMYVTCMSGLIDIFGWDMLLCTAGTDPNGFSELTNRYCAWIQHYFNALAQCDSPIVMVHDDIVWTSGAFIHPDWYRKYLFPNYKKMFAPLIEAKKKIVFTSDGTYDEFIDDIAQTGINAFVLEPTTNMQYIADKYGKTHAFIGNADTRILLMGTKEDIEAEVKRCMDIGKKYPGFFMAVGNHIPANTPIENAIFYNEMYEKYSKR